MQQDAAVQLYSYERRCALLNPSIGAVSGVPQAEVEEAILGGNISRIMIVIIIISI
jgi:hypothetical protein